MQIEFLINEFSKETNERITIGDLIDANLLNYEYISLNPVPNAQVCMYLMIHITKLQLQTTFTFLYMTFHMYPLGPYPLKILMFALFVTREIITYN